MSFADAIIKLRSERRISQKELAEELNVSCATVNRWENGRTVPGFCPDAGICRRNPGERRRL